MKKLLDAAVAVRPSPRQLAWFEMGFYGFLHFTVNTYTDREWGLGDEDPAIFNPTDLDADEWILAMKEAGMKGAILTAKHHDGFCLWPSRYTEHSVKNSPWKGGKGDVVAEVAAACRRHGLKFGVYLSPWDRNSALYGTPEYNDYYANQLTELLTEYGELFCVWQDNACGEGPNGKKQVYDFPRFNALIRQYQPDAFIFNDFGPDVRWCGNEAGSTRAEEWAVVPRELVTRSEGGVPVTPLREGGLEGIYNTDIDLGTLANISYSKELVFAPSEFDTSIRRGWFYHASESPRSVDELFDVYLRTVGGNGCLNLNVPPNREGRFDPRDIETLRALGERIRTELCPSPVKWEKVGEEGTRSLWSAKLDGAKQVKYVILREDLTQGQRVESFKIKAKGGSVFTATQGRTVGNCKICPVNFKAEEVLVEVTAARAPAIFKSIEVCLD